MSIHNFLKIELANRYKLGLTGVGLNGQVSSKMYLLAQYYK